MHDVAGKHRMLTGLQGVSIGSQPTASASMAVHLLRRRQLQGAGLKELAELKMEAEPSRLFLMHQKESVALAVLQQPRAVGASRYSIVQCGTEALQKRGNQEKMSDLSRLLTKGLFGEKIIRRI